MTVVTVSPKYQVVIPKDVREQLDLKPGQKVEAFAFGNRIELVPVRSPSELRGFLRDMENDFTREADRL
ncbi:MAG TPA: AbrB/MazE/SpoVT family DNA-binding domain-containing protein [Longimicrobiales bacterium]|nr:AbrB/MazE/SpoVT family DNA-binding domain-containing protein [Longimicrobiales bacterium]